MSDQWRPKENDNATIPDEYVSGVPIVGKLGKLMAGKWHLKVYRFDEQVGEEMPYDYDVGQDKLRASTNLDSARWDRMNGWKRARADPSLINYFWLLVYVLWELVVRAFHLLYNVLWLVWLWLDKNAEAQGNAQAGMVGTHGVAQVAQNKYNQTVGMYS